MDVKTEVIAELRKRNPYPEDIFTKMNREDIRRYVRLLQTIHANWGREVWDNYISELEKLLKECRDRERSDFMKEKRNAKEFMYQAIIYYDHGELQEAKAALINARHAISKEQFEIEGIGSEDK